MISRESLEEALDIAYDFKFNDSTTNTDLSFIKWKKEIIDQLLKEQESE